MITRKIFTEYSQFSYKDNKQEMLDLVTSSCIQYPDGIAPDYVQQADGTFKTKRRDQKESLRDMLAALALCNNVTPVAEEEKVEERRATFD